MPQKINIIIIAVFLLIVGFGFAWADIDVEDVLDFNYLDQDDMVVFNPPGATTIYSLGIDVNGYFIIAQVIDSVVTPKFKIDPDGNVYIMGSIETGTVPWSGVSVPADCEAGLILTGIDDVNGALICSAP